MRCVSDASAGKAPSFLSAAAPGFRLESRRFEGKKEGGSEEEPRTCDRGGEEPSWHCGRRAGLRRRRQGQLRVSLPPLPLPEPPPRFPSRRPGRTGARVGGRGARISDPGVGVLQRLLAARGGARVLEGGS